jgi:hypothetical protein
MVDNMKVTVTIQHRFEKNFTAEFFLNLKKRVKHKDEDVSLYTMTGYDGSGGMATLNLRTIWREGSTLVPGRFTPR